MQATHRGLRAKPQVRLTRAMSNILLFSQTKMWACSKQVPNPSGKKKKIKSNTNQLFISLETAF